MGNFLKKKLFVLFLMFSVLVFVPTHVAHAEGAIGTILSVIVTVVVVAIVIVQPELLGMVVFLPAGGTFIGLAGTATAILVSTVAIGVGVGGGILSLGIACAEGLICGSGTSGGVPVAVVAPASGDCSNSQTMHFYIPQINTNYRLVDYPSIGESDAYTSCEVDPNFTEDTRQVVIYRAELSTDSSQATLNDWFINQIKVRVGGGFLDVQNSDYNTNEYSILGTTFNIIYTAPVSTFCTGGVCTFQDNSVPDNSYVVYVAKIMGTYTGQGQMVSGSCSDGECNPDYNNQRCDVTNANKFLNNDNTSSVVFPGSTLGNAIVGPFQTFKAYCKVDGACGSANGASLTAAPATATSLCSTGAPSAVSGSGPWSWSCAGSVPTARSYQCPSNNNTAGSVGVCGAPYTCNGQLGTESTCIGSDHGDPCQYYHTYNCTDVTPAAGSTATCQAAPPPSSKCGTANGKTYPNDATNYGSDTQCVSPGISSNTAFPVYIPDKIGSAWICTNPDGSSPSPMCSASKAAPLATGTWTAPTCQTACSTAASNPAYTCVGGNGVCSTNTPATLSCAATPACATGTWTAPTCPSACGTAASNPAYTCVGGNGVCSTNIPATLSCAATPACVCAPPSTQNVTVACDPNTAGVAATSGSVTRSQTKSAYPACTFGMPVTTSNSTYVTDNCEYPPSVNGVCSVAHYYCGAPTASTNNSNNTNSWTWSCPGTYGGTTASCSETKPAPVVTLTASPSSVAYNGRSTLTWSSTNASSCTAGGNWGTSGNLSGSGLTDPLTSTQTYTLQCFGNGQTSALQSVTVSVGALNGACSATHYTCVAGTSASNSNNASTYTWSCTGLNGGTTASCSEAKPAPTASLTASPTSIAYNGRSTLTWSSTNASSCTAGGNWGTSGNLSGSGLTDALTSTQTYTLRCYGNGQYSAPQSVTVNVASLNGACSSPQTHYSCSAGTSASNSDNARTWTWSCTGLNGGTTASCSETKPGVCGPDSGLTPKDPEPVGAPACANGTLNANAPADTATTWKWSCGVEDNCSAPKYGCPVATDTNYNPNNTANDWGCALTCANGTSNYPTCSQCPNNLAYVGGKCVACSNDGCTGPGGTTSDPTGGLSCNNSAINPVACSIFKPTATLSASPTEIDRDQSTTLTWSSTYATYCVLSTDPSTHVAANDHVQTAALTDNPSNFQITCTGAGGSATATASVTVLQPYVSISASPTRVTSGDNSTISWSASQVKSCAVSGPGLSPNPRTDYAVATTSQSVPITMQSIYTITCKTNHGADKKATTVVNVTASFKEF